MLKKLFAIALIFLCTLGANAQAPNQFNYQGVARNSFGLPLAATTIGMRLTIHDGSTTGTTVYQETHTATTNAFGLYNVAIGSGTVVSGTFSGINWGTGSKYLQVELDPAGGTSYTSVGTNELLSVPYSIYSNSSGASGVSGSASHLAKFTSPNTVGNSKLTDSSVGLMYNTSVFLAPSSMKFSYKAPTIAGSGNWFSYQGDVNGFSFITVSDSSSAGSSGEGNRGIIFTSSQNLPHIDTGATIDYNTVELIQSPSSHSFYITNSSSTWMSIDMSSGVVGITSDLSTGGNLSVAGNLSVTGSISKGSGTFKIDHPLDPENKYLYHSFVESPDMMNIYNGNITTDANGNAEIKLPDYFEALNTEYRYQLTVIGTFAQAMISEKVHNNKFTIKTNLPNVEVSWQVTGIRNDKFAQAHRVVPEVEKEKKNKGKYLHPAEYGKPANMGIDYGMNPSLKTK